MSESAVPEPGSTSGAPHDGKHYQDQWPANPAPSEAAAAKGAENDKVFADMRAPYVEAASGKSSKKEK